MRKHTDTRFSCTDEAMGCSVSASSPSSDVSKVEVTWPNIDAPVYFVKRADNATSSDFSVSDFETYIKDAHEAAISASDDTYGFATCGEWASLSSSSPGRHSSQAPRATACETSWSYS